jgi:prepilin-type N-terminal cleavage/methylation domain-containing protein
MSTAMHGRPRRGFTLFELMVAIVVTSVVVLLAYGTLQAGLDADVRLGAHRATVAAEVQLRAMLVDALRHPADAPQDGAVAFEVRRGVTATGLSADTLRFFSRGVVTPLGTSEPWDVVLAPAADGVRFIASPLGAATRAAVVAAVSEVRGVRVRTLAQASTGGEWIDGWTGDRGFPDAVEISFADSAGRVTGPPLVVKVGGGVRGATGAER